ncbi:transglycosylase domain-containing protein [Brevibacterium luteolum]|uniref:transglycosylase domain-containing protein n=1 Tax=Brevibacterium luteolum TaxID=199591 RepID=UPI0020B440A9|nr:transglycosylase domain-containing protein [Brevibacterium luteolum]
MSERVSQLIRSLVSFAAASVCMGILIAGLGLPVLGASVTAAHAGIDIFKALPSEFQDRPLAQPSRVLDRNGDLITEFYWQNRREVRLADVSEPMKTATLAVEDHRFYDHGSIDLQGIARAVAKNVLSGSREGGSTLTQQYVKNALIQESHARGDEAGVEEARSRDGAAGYARKLREMKLAAAVENAFSKDEILERYLNINSYSGSPNVYGVEAAARQYWNKSAADLSIAQAATLAGIVRNPSKYNPQRDEAAVLERRNTVLGQMLKYGYISREDYDDAVGQDLGLDETVRPNGCAGTGGRAYFCDYVQHQVLQSPAFGSSIEDRSRQLKQGGLTITTTLDPVLQKKAEKEVRKRLPVGDPSGAKQALVSLDVKSGGIRAMAQNTEYSPAESKDDSATAVNYNAEKSFGGGTGYQPGSTWKPFVLAEWLQSGHTLTETVNASGSMYRGFSTASCDDRSYASAGYNPRNAGDSGGASGRMSVFDATRKSVNKAYADMASELDMCAVRDTASALGVRAGDGSALADVTLADGMQQVLYPSSILGTVSVAPVTMAASYTAFANEGRRCGATAISRATDSDGKELDLPDTCKEALDPEVAEAVAYTLSQTFNGGTTQGLGIGAPAAAKTGTTNFEVGASWTVGFTSDVVTAVWTGDPNGVRDWRDNRRGRMPRTVFGATVSGPTWQAFMRTAAAEGEPKPFPRPSATYMPSSESRGSSRPSPSRGPSREDSPSPEPTSDAEREPDDDSSESPPALGG